MESGIDNWRRGRKGKEKRGKKWMTEEEKGIGKGHRGGTEKGNG